MSYTVLILTEGRLRSLHVSEEAVSRKMAEDALIDETEAMRRIAASTPGAEKVWVLDRAALSLGGGYPEAYVYTGDDAAPLGYDLEKLRARRRRELAERREAEENGGFAFEGFVIPSDLAARLDLASLPERAAAGGALDWKVADATWLTLDVSGAQGLRGALWAHLAGCAAREKAGHAVLAALATPEAIVGWAEGAPASEPAFA